MGKVHKKTSRQYLSAMQIVPWVRRQEVTDVDENFTAGEELSKVADIVAGCRECALHLTRCQTVFGAGNLLSDWLFVGEAPGAEEDRRGVPFVGRAGQLLDAMITAIGIERSEAYIANVLKCRPPDNRDPLGVEVQSCLKYLHLQIELVKPSIIIALGRFAAQSLLKSTLPIGKLRGSVHRFQPFDIPLVATYHPAYLLRSPLEKRKTWSDLLLAKTVVS